MFSRETAGDRRALASSSLSSLIIRSGILISSVSVSRLGRLSGSMDALESERTERADEPGEAVSCGESVGDDLTRPTEGDETGLSVASCFGGVAAVGGLTASVSEPKPPRLLCA